MSSKFSMVPLVEECSIPDYVEIIHFSIDVLSQVNDPEFPHKPENIQLLEHQLARWKVKYYSGGQSVAFALKFEFPGTSLPLIIKAYTKLKPAQLAYHIITSKIFLQDVAAGITFEGKKYLIIPARNILISHTKYLNAVFLIQNFSTGKIIDKRIPITKIVKEIASKGYIIDPYLKNWRLLSNYTNKDLKIEYIDTIFTNRITDFESVKQITNKMMNFEY